MELNKRYFLGLLSVVLFFLLCVSASAIVGISPGLYEIDFKPGLKQDFRYTILGDTNMQFRIFAEGELAQYTTISPKSLDRPGDIVVTLNLPDNLNLPGENILFISAKQQGSGKGGISLLGNVKGIIKVRVPYPDEYATASLSSTNANAGKPIKLKATINNLGKQDILAKTSIKIYDSLNRSVTTLPTGDKEVPSLGSVVVETQLNTEGYLPGYYRAELIVEYGDKIARAETVFRLGEFFVNITGHSNDFTRDVLNKLDLEIESFWSDSIEDVYANITIINHTNINFITNPVNLEGFQKSSVTGYFDTTGILEEDFKAKAVLHYNDRTTERILSLRFKKEKSNNTIYYLAGILVGLILVWMLISLVVRRIKANGKGRK